MRKFLLHFLVAALFALIVAQPGPVLAIGCSVGEVLCVQDCGGGRLCKTYCGMKRRACEGQKATPQVGTRPSPNLPTKKIDIGAPKPAGSY
jgi:hypothetical protein